MRYIRSICHYYIMSCRICLEDTGTLIQPCKCMGYDHGYFHNKCLSTWVSVSGNEKCEICKENFYSREECGCTPGKYIYQFFCFKSGSEFESTLLQSTGIMFIMYIICFFLTPDASLLSMSIFNTYVIIMVLLAIQIFQRGRYEFFILNVGVMWKSAYVLCAFLCLLVRDCFSTDDCHYSCVRELYLMGCETGCPYFNSLTHRRSIYIDCMFVNIINLLVLIFARCVQLCFSHMRKRSYVTLEECGLKEVLKPPPEGEETCLLDSP